MARPRDLRLLGLAFFALCLLAAGGGLTGAVPTGSAEGSSQPAVAARPPAVDVAVLPARLVDDVRSAASAGPSRSRSGALAGHVTVVALGAVLASLLGLPALVGRTSPPSGPGRRPLHSRRFAIALRAPPLPFAA